MVLPTETTRIFAPSTGTVTPRDIADACVEAGDNEHRDGADQCAFRCAKHKPHSKWDRCGDEREPKEPAGGPVSEPLCLGRRVLGLGDESPDARIAVSSPIAETLMRSAVSVATGTDDDQVINAQLRRLDGHDRAIVVDPFGRIEQQCRQKSSWWSVCELDICSESFVWFCDRCPCCTRYAP